MLFSRVEDHSKDFYHHLVYNWEIKEEYVKEFLEGYKKEISKLYKSGKKRMAIFGDEMEFYLTDLQKNEFILDLAVVEQAIIAYKRDFMKGKNLTPKIETIVWGILVSRPDLVDKADKVFSTYIQKNAEKHISKIHDMFNFDLDS